MFIWNDMSYIENMFAVEHGYARVGVHGLRLDAHNGDVIYKRMNGDELLRGYSRNITRKEMERRVKAVCDALNERFKVYQYLDREAVSYGSKWDLFFWCNHKSGEDGEGRDFSYVTLGFNDKERDGMTYEERAATLEAVIAFIKTLDIDIDVAIQHDLCWEQEKVKAAVTAFCEEYVAAKKPELIQYGHELGKIRKLDDGRFGFFKKGAKTRGYLISPDDKTILWLSCKKDEVAA